MIWGDNTNHRIYLPKSDEKLYEIKEPICVKLFFKKGDDNEE